MSNYCFRNCKIWVEIHQHNAAQALLEMTVSIHTQMFYLKLDFSVVCLDKKRTHLGFRSIICVKLSIYNQADSFSNKALSNGGLIINKQNLYNHTQGTH